MMLMKDNTWSCFNRQDLFCNEQEGFSVFELIIVLSVVAIISGYVIARVDLSSPGAAVFEEDMRSALRFAQKLAISSGCDVQVTISAASNSLALHYRQDVTSPASCLTATGSFTQPVINPRTQQSYVIDSSVNVQTSTVFYFDGAGVPDNGAQSINVGGRLIQVEAKTGYVH